MKVSFNSIAESIFKRLEYDTILQINESDIVEQYKYDFKYALSINRISPLVNLTDKCIIYLIFKTGKSLREIIDTMIDTYTRKNNDYGDSFNNSLNYFGLESGNYSIYHKISRIESLTGRQQLVKDESIVDTVMDLANYCIMLWKYILEEKIKSAIKPNPKTKVIVDSETDAIVIITDTNIQVCAREEILFKMIYGCLGDINFVCQHNKISIE